MSTVGGAYPNGDKITNAELIPGFYLGLHFKYRPRRFISLSTGFNYVSKGANIDSNSEITQMGVNAAKLRSINAEIPILLQLNFAPYSPNRPHLFIGPSLSWMVVARDNFTVDYYGPLPAPMLEVGEYYHSFDPGLIIGGGIDIDVAEWNIFTMGLRYTHGFRNITDSESSIFVNENIEIKNRNFVVYLGYTFVIPTYTMNSPGKKNKRDKYKPMSPKKYKN